MCDTLASLDEIEIVSICGSALFVDAPHAIVRVVGSQDVGIVAVGDDAHGCFSLPMLHDARQRR